LRDRFLDDEALLAYLTEGKINYIVLDDTVMHPKRASYQDQLKRVVADSMADANATGHTFWKVDEFPMTRENEGVPPPIRLYRVTTIR
jgi:hypothetical protein